MILMFDMLVFVIVSVAGRGVVYLAFLILMIDMVLFIVMMYG